MEIKTIGDATLWYNNHCRGLDDWGKMAMKNIWESRTTDKERIEFVQSVQYAKEQFSKSHQFQEQVDRLVKQEDAHKFVQLIEHEGILTALDARGKVWRWHLKYWKQLNPERVPYGLEKKTTNQIRAERGIAAVEDIRGSGYEGDLR